VRSRFLILALVLAGGCHVVWKDSYWEDAKTEKLEAEPPDLTPVQARLLFLGVRVPAKPALDADGKQVTEGLPILHVFGSSPAAIAGLASGDEVRQLGGLWIGAADELRNALAVVSPVTSLVFARDGQEHTIRIGLVPWASYLKERRKRVFSDAEYYGLSLPFFFDYVTRELSPDFVQSYFGADVKDSVQVYRDLDIFPLWKTGISVFRRETLNVYDSSRTQVIMWPIRFTTEGADRTTDLDESIPLPPAGTNDL